MASPPPPPSSDKEDKKDKKSGGGGSSGGGGGGGSAPAPKTAAQKHAEKSAKSKGSETYPGVNVFGQPITVADFRRARQHYNDFFRSYIGRKASRKEVERILRRGISDYQLGILLMKKPTFRKGAMFRAMSTQLNSLTGVGLDRKVQQRIMLRAARGQGGVTEASLRASILQSNVAKKALTQSLRRTSGAEIDYLSGSFGGGQFSNADYRALALQQSGLKTSTMGAKLQGALDRALRASERIFQGQLATPSLSIGPAGLQTQQRDEDLPA